MGEICTKPIELASGETWSNETDDDAIIFTAAHSHNDILRYVVKDIGADALVLVRELVGDAG
ncbi:hypothetical protein [Novosphingobium sp. FKTRR1]|uniref:hypothetical protein n=1 Tax=Novosphingobium sp. FKTRR1 TaxID=2879118 RepID=UPI001CF0A140|nr:hypothetical protein [Novosphingobium sp. FKTRR1]